MATFKKRACSECGRDHQGKTCFCHRCIRAKRVASINRNCMICDTPITDTSRAHLWYCTNDCGMIVRKARETVSAAVFKKIKLKEIPKASSLKCVDCGKDAFDYDHRLYKKPEDVVPVCRGCNIKRGPATDVKSMVADYLGVQIDDVSGIVREHVSLAIAYRKSMDFRYEFPTLDKSFAADLCVKRKAA